jgi:3-methyladenine DNA glycosylase Mpg
MSGPGRLTKAFGIDSFDNETDLLSGKGSISISTVEQVTKVGTSPRIGIAIGKGEELLRRFVDLNNLEWITKHRTNTGLLGD